MFRHSLAIGLATITIIFSCAVQAQPAARGSQPSYTVNFKDTDIHEVIKFVADATGKTIVIDPRVKGRIKVISQTTVNKDELFELFLTILEVHDFTAVQVGDVVRILPLKDARSSPVPVQDESDVGNRASTNGYVTEVIQLKNIEAAKVLPVLRPLVPQHSHLSSYTESNVIVVSDTAPNIARLRDVIERIDTAALPTTEVVPLKYADAEDLVATLTKLDRGEKQSSTPVNQLQIVADKRNNSVLLSGEDIQRKRAKDLIRKLDRPPVQMGNVRVVYLNYANAKDVAATLSKVVQNMQQMQPGGKDKGGKDGATVEADEDTNALLLTGSGDMLNSLLTIVERLDIKRAQVLVEAIIVDINVDANKELGVQWMFSNENNGTFGGSSQGDGSLGSLAAGTLGGGTDALTNLASGIAGNTGQLLGVAGNNGGENFIALLSALQTSSDANILSTPSLVTMDNQEASISVGQSVPFRTGSYSTTGTTGSVGNPFTTIQREDVGITLTVTPHVNEGNKILLDISQEVSSISSSVAGSADLITNQSKIETQLLANDGQIVILGGLIQEDVQDGATRVPLLGSIPLLGHLFKYQSTKFLKKNLMVFIRVKIVTDDEAMYGATAEKYQYIRDQQMHQHDKGLNLMSRKVLPVLPELTPFEQQALEAALSESDSEQE
ncbi:type II secretion system secretin GspD [Saccharophagus degradans]|uniref:Type II secretion system secretin GspD n=1 Tax=Saccharophagus degradans TaxID=86304 RepID=A0AAW7XAZ7_9GAMM|nr:type II secretion system secretin GspD [Saccharophagus degradans]MBU2986127.1 type II secretion system secretin GspD [Saccharophagus degradans]MDO6423612.1 type II secretion system secretin GspD [Saccharophagus degradans]MDO6607716.1 type II secretion system secretin GspD [Saccharophagus degradans]WGO98978.1 type II secretion system secretin GspD [Saccharophagus degradans]